MDELISNLTKKELKYIKKLKENFENRMLEETRKFNRFFKFVFENSVKKKLY